LNFLHQENLRFVGKIPPELRYNMVRVNETRVALSRGQGDHSPGQEGDEGAQTVVVKVGESEEEGNTFPRDYGRP
jgi:hypothetical protein